MGTLKDDSVLNKLRALSETPWRGCARMDCGQTSGAPVHDGVPMGETEAHAFVDPADEPIFVLRAQDIKAVQTVQYWMNHLYPNLKTEHPEKYEEAAAWCSKALTWPKKKAAN